jgi:uncharacterized membrane protein
MLSSASRRDDGQLTLLIIGLTFIAATLVLVGVDASKVFLARRALASAADAAALAGAQAVDKSALYAGAAMDCGAPLPLDAMAATSYADDALAGEEPGLRQTFGVLDPANTSVAAGTVSVHLSGRVALPFGRVLALLLPSDSDGTVAVSVTSSAQSPRVAPGGC